MIQEKLERNFQIKLTLSEYRFIEQQALVDRRSISDYGRGIILNHIENTKSESSFENIKTNEGE